MKRNDAGIPVNETRIDDQITYDDFTREFERLSGICLQLYKENQMKRRINTLIERKKAGGYGTYLDLLRTDKNELARFIDYITINVTEFFRTPEHWRRFEEEVLAKLTEQKNGTLKIWCCACSTGEEAYSLAISLLMFTGASDFHIIATDIDEGVVQKAMLGKFGTKSIGVLPDTIRSRYFNEEGGYWVAKSELKSCITFGRLDLLKDLYPDDCDLIVCRNVLIYFTEDAKDRVYTNFKKSLKPGGYLFTGKTEQIVYYKKRGFHKINTFLYQSADC